MTSRALYSNKKAGPDAGVSFPGLLISELKRKAWVIALCTLNFIMWGPVFTMLEYESDKRYYDRSTLVMQIGLKFMPDIRNIFSVGMIAVLLGLCCYWFLLSKKKTDLYHSLPVTRKKLFFVMYVTGIVIFAVTYLFATVILMIASVANGFYMFTAFSYHISAIAMDIVFFFMMYNLTIIAVMLTGNAVVSLCAVGVLNFIYPLMSACFAWLADIYFNTKSTFGEVGRSLWSRFPYPAPLYTYARYINGISGTSNDLDGFQKIAGNAEVLGISILIAALYLAASYVLYLKRPSEAAGKAIAFKVSQPVIRIPLVIIAAFVFACGTESVINEERSAWVWIMLIFGGVLMHCVLEIIFNFDFRALFKHSVQMAACIGVSALVLAGFWFDVFGYDTYLPDRDSIEEASVYFNGMDSMLVYSTLENVNEDGRCDMRYTGGLRRMSEHAFTDDAMIDGIYALAKKGTEHVHDNDDDNEKVNYVSYPVAGPDGPTSVFVAGKTDVIGSADTSSGRLEYIINNRKSDDSVSVYVAWKLRSGRRVCRCYRISASLIRDEIDNVYRMREYKEAAFDLYDAAKLGVAEYVHVTDCAEKVVLVLNKPDDVRAFLDAYIADMDKAGVDTISQLPIASLDVNVRIKNAANDSGLLYGYYIYPDFANTLAFMEKMNADMSHITTKVDPDRVESIIAFSHDYITGKPNGDENEEDPSVVEGMYLEKKYLADDEHGREMIELLCKDLENTIYDGSNSCLTDLTNRKGLGFTVYYEVEGGIQRNFTASLHSGDVPQELIEDLVESED